MTKPDLTSITSTGDRLDAKDHEIDIRAVISNPVSLGDVGSEFTDSQKRHILKKLNFESLVDLDNLTVAAAFMIEKIQGLGVDEALQILKQFLIDHDNDVNIDVEFMDLIENLVAKRPESPMNIDERMVEKIDGKLEVFDVQEKTHITQSEEEFADWELLVRTEAGIIAYWSPYPEVRSVTDPFDDPEDYAETWRVYFLGAIWTAIGSFINEFFMERYPSITLNASVVQVFMYPCGVLLALCVPKRKIKILGQVIDTNPGPWSLKEQMLTTLMYSVSSSYPYVSYNIPVLKMEMFYNVSWCGWGYQILLMLSTNFMGFGFAGIMRKFCVYPVRAIWPTMLPTLALNRALLATDPKENINGWTISKYKFFFITFAASFCYYWLPGYLFQAISNFNWTTWIAPDNNNLASITGTVTGMGFNPISSFDWNVLSFYGPLAMPFYSFTNQFIGAVLGFFCIIGVWYTNYKWTGYLPINSNSIFTNTGESYDVTQVVNSKSLLDKSKYEVYGSPFYTAANMVVYGSFFAIYPFSAVYIVGTNWVQMKNSMLLLYESMKDFRKSTYDGFNDPFTRSMTRYKEVPEWCFSILLVLSVVLAIICVKAYPAETPVWGIFFSLGINFVFLIPLTVIYSATGFSFGLNVLVELIVGYALPGNGIALMFIKALGYNIDGQAQDYVTNQKMAHYARIPPRALFRVQMISVFVASFVSLAVINFQISNVDGFCTLDQKDKLTCANARTFYTASVLWGVIGPKRVFSDLYPILKYCFLIGFLLSIPFTAFKVYGNKNSTIKKNAIFKAFNPVLVIGGFLSFAPYNLSYYIGGMYLSYFFMHYIRKRYVHWWEKYNYIFNSGMNGGLAFASIIIFFAVEYKGYNVNWWGNNVPYVGYDGTGYPRLNVTDAPGGFFGPRTTS